MRRARAKRFQGRRNSKCKGPGVEKAWQELGTDRRSGSVECNASGSEWQEVRRGRRQDRGPAGAWRPLQSVWVLLNGAREGAVIYLGGAPHTDLLDE